jgi:hypothetical protein
MVAFIGNCRTEKETHLNRTSKVEGSIVFFLERYIS